MGSPGGQGRWPILWEMGEGGAVRGGGRTPVFIALVCDLHFCFFPAALGGMGVQARAGRAGEEGGVAGHPGRVGWMGTVMAPGVRQHPVFGSPGEEVSPALPLSPTL